jgi:hypothetical protein
MFALVCSTKISLRKNFPWNLDQERGKPLFDLLTKTHQKFENILHPKILHIKNIFIDFFNKRRQLIGTNKQLPEPKVNYFVIEIHLKYSFVVSSSCSI